MIPALLFGFGVGFCIAAIAVNAMHLRAELSAAAVWESAWRDECVAHVGTLAELRQVEQERDLAAAQAALGAAALEAAGSEREREPLRVGDDVRERFCWN
jgi:hypothetical protein